MDDEFECETTNLLVDVGYHVYCALSVYADEVKAAVDH